MISRRAFIGAVAGGLAVAPAATSAPQAKNPARIDYGIVPPSLLARADEVIQG